MEIMRSVGLYYRDRRIIYELYKNQRGIININGEIKEACIHIKGCGKDVPYPRCFSIYMLRKELTKVKKLWKINGVAVKMIKFADDIAVPEDIADKLQDTLIKLN